MTNVVSLLGWTFLPNLITGWIQTVYYGITIRAGDPKPAPGSARHNAHRRVIYILVVAFYLAYTIFEADHDIRAASSYYADLGVSPSATDRDIKSRYRRLAALHHPDKAGTPPSDDDSAAAYFMRLKTASETLLNPTRRFAYERFGPDVNAWQRCKTVADFVHRGIVQGILPHYGVATAAMYVLGLFGYMDFGRFYRWLILLVLCVFEVHAVTRPYFPASVNALNAVVTTVSSHPPYMPFQVITLARKITVTVYIALSQIGPVLTQHLRGEEKPPSADGGDDDGKALRQGLDRLEGISRQLGADVARLMEMETAPYKGDGEATSNLQGKIREWLVQNTIRADPMVRDALGTSIGKRRLNAPRGARGNNTGR
ncbi:Chaperone protein-like protein [Hapsidospora chrysogenum ATCC 11550]|uniref:Chaperone protein-like protein n=1 Tax=Hapsidospora chrysogenum (strain ATCC 11550 / CBS 779.69 / DSM 880 / IAM 14645 / JCM 23072 / IMI 49137) TaxID=857340 RepID=A0A086T5Y6_HAPC1|nr:Chaperone protein-like protein [Hapsidospora chrysogenum ATCC 11550]